MALSAIEVEIIYIYIFLWESAKVRFPLTIYSSAKKFGLLLALRVNVGRTRQRTVPLLMMTALERFSPKCRK